MYWLWLYFIWNGYWDDYDDIYNFGINILNTNKLTKDIINYLVMRGHFVMGINNIPGAKPEILGCTKKGIALAIEIKTTDKQSEEQKQYQENFEKRNGIYILARKVEDVINKL